MASKVEAVNNANGNFGRRHAMPELRPTKRPTAAEGNADDTAAKATTTVAPPKIDVATAVASTAVRADTAAAAI